MNLDGLKKLLVDPRKKKLIEKLAKDEERVFFGSPGCLFCGAPKFHMLDMEPSEGFGSQLKVCPACMRKVL